MINLEATIRGCVKKDRKAQEEFFKYFYGRLLVVSQRVSPNDNIANDVLQDSFLKIFDKIHLLDNFNEAVVFSWCKRIITNTAVDFFRSEKKHYKETSNKISDYNDGIIDYVEVNNKVSCEDVPSRWVDNSTDFKSLPEKFCGEHVWTSPYSGIAPEITIKAIQSLSPQYRLVFNLYVMDGLTHEEIAEKLNISVGTSKANLFRAKAKLKEILTPKLEEC